MKQMINLISSYPFFSGMSHEHLAIAVEGATGAEFRAGEILFRQGEPANRFFMIQSGRVLLEAQLPEGGHSNVQILTAGEVVGWSWLFPPFTWHFQARALEPTKVIVLNGAHLLANAEKNHDFGFELIKRVAQVVIHRLQATRKQLVELQITSPTEI